MAWSNDSTVTRIGICYLHIIIITSVQFYIGRLFCLHLCRVGKLRFPYDPFLTRNLFQRFLLNVSEKVRNTDVFIVRIVWNRWNLWEIKITKSCMKNQNENQNIFLKFQNQFHESLSKNLLNVSEKHQIPHNYQNTI